MKTQEPQEHRLGVTAKTLALASVALFAGVHAGFGQSTLVEDDFNRSDSSTLGTMSDGTNSWNEFDPNGAFETQVNSNQFWLKNDGGAAVDGFTLADGTIEMDVEQLGNTSSDSYQRQGFSYRQTSEADATTNRPGSVVGYRVGINTDFSGPNDVVLYKGTKTIIGSANLGSSFSPFTVRAEFSGTSHQIFVDNSLEIDQPDSDISSAGSVGVSVEALGAGQSDTFRVDNFSVIPEPSSYALIGGIAALGFAALRSRGRR